MEVIKGFIPGKIMPVFAFVKDKYYVYLYTKLNYQLARLRGIKDPFSIRHIE